MPTTKKKKKKKQEKNNKQTTTTIGQYSPKILTQRRNDTYLLYRRSGYCASLLSTVTFNGFIAGLYRRSGYCASLLSTVTFNGFYDTSKYESMH